MKYEFSDVGRKMTGHSGIVSLMEDLGQALTGDQDVLMMGGGGPAIVPGVRELWRERMTHLLADPDQFDRMLGHYDPPRGNIRFIEAFTHFMNRTYGWDITTDHVAITGGGQAAFFFLFNLLSGQAGERIRKVVFPFSPEYIGYADQGIAPGTFVSVRPDIEKMDSPFFKYRASLERLEGVKDAAALCLSRPTNPTGNVVGDTELEELKTWAFARGIPLIVDCAYGRPFPGIVFKDTQLHWEPGIIMTFSLSKMGLPTTRTGIIVAEPDIIKAVTNMNSIVGLANSNIGQVIVTPLLESGRLAEAAATIVKPFYRKKTAFAVSLLKRAFANCPPFRMHCSEGAFFLWLWFEKLPISDRALYERLKKRRVLVVPGSYFFYGLEDAWAHSRECIRISCSQSEDVMERGIAILAEEVTRAYRE